jgi:EmrB/QacA subfamily drug resistance transporter
MIGRLSYKSFVAAIYVLGLFMSLLDLTITNVALPVLAKEFNAEPATIAWVATGYLLSVAVSIPLSGWFGDRFGTKRTFIFALALFTFGSLACGLVSSLSFLIAARVVQGVGGGLMTPVGAAMVFRAYPLAERARVSALITVPAVVAPALGPIVGGYLVEYHSWHWIFLINVPLGLIGLGLAAWRLQEFRVTGVGRLDLPGIILAPIGLATAVYSLSEVGRRGITDPLVLALGGLGLAALALFALVELRVAAPLIDLRLYRDRLFTTGNLTLFPITASFFGVVFLLPQLLQGERGLTPLTSGLTTFPTAIGIMLAAPLVGRLYPWVGPRRLVLSGVALTSVSVLSLSLIDLNTSLWQIRAQMLPLGVAFGLVFIPLQTASFAGISSELTGRATAAYNAVRQVATSCGVALIATVLSSRLTSHGAILGGPSNQTGAVTAFHETFLVPAAFALTALLAVILIDDRLAAQTMRRVARVEDDASHVISAGQVIEQPIPVAGNVVSLDAERDRVA